MKHLFDNVVNESDISFSDCLILRSTFNLQNGEKNQWNKFVYLRQSVQRNSRVSELINLFSFHVERVRYEYKIAHFLQYELSLPN